MRISCEGSQTKSLSSSVKCGMDDEVKKLAEELAGYREAYYNLDPLVPDDIYDAKKEALRKLCPEHFEVTAVGAEPPRNSPWEKVAHEISMGSLNKVNIVEEFDEWVSKTEGATHFGITHKIDGASLELIYKAGKLVRGVTRGGSNQIGENVTSNIVKIPDLPKELALATDATVRGEVVMFKNVFTDKYADKGYANPRNTAAAKMREMKGGGADCANLAFLAYWIQCEDRPNMILYMFKLLESLGFKTPPLSVGDIDSIKVKFAEATKDRANVPYDIDGMVVSVADLKLLEALGDVAMRPRGQIAWKFESEKAESRVLDIVWQVGPTGRCCPVAKIEPTKIGGVTIESVSLHNLKMFTKLKLFRGCRVLIERRNDVIPYLAANLDKLDI